MLLTKAGEESKEAEDHDRNDDQQEVGGIPGVSAI